MLISEFRGNLPVIEIKGDCEAYKRLGILLEEKKDDFKFTLALEEHCRFNSVDVFCLDTNNKDTRDFLICIDKKIVCVFSTPLEESVDISTIILNYFLGVLDNTPGIEEMYDRCRADCKREKCCRVHFEEILFNESLGSEEVVAPQPQKVGA